MPDRFRCCIREKRESVRSASLPVTLDPIQSELKSTARSIFCLHALNRFLSWHLHLYKRLLTFCSRNIASTYICYWNLHRPAVPVTSMKLYSGMPWSVSVMGFTIQNSKNHCVPSALATEYQLHRRQFPSQLTKCYYCLFFNGYAYMEVFLYGHCTEPLKYVHVQ